MFEIHSNIASNAINNYTMHHYLDGKSREDIRLKDVESIIMKEAFTEKGEMVYIYKYCTLSKAIVI